MAAGPRSQTLPWWRRKPHTPGGIALYLILMAIFSGFFSVFLNRLITGETHWNQFISGAVIGLVINAVTLALQQRQAHH